jgi:hypothetical protein
METTNFQLKVKFKRKTTSTNGQKNQKNDDQIKK